MKDIIIIGAGGFGREVAMLIQDINNEKPTWNIKGFIDDNPEIQGDIVYGIKVIGDINWLLEQELLIVNAIGDSVIRQQINRRIKSSNNSFATLIHPTVLLTPTVNIGEGTIICAGNIITTDVSIGNHVIVNLSSTIGHDAVIKDYVTILPGANISGYVTLNQSVMVGTGSQIIENVTVGESTIIGAGATVVSDLPANCTAVGTPAKPIKIRK